jgi:hypothetical protein
MLGIVIRVNEVVEDTGMARVVGIDLSKSLAASAWRSNP